MVAAAVALLITPSMAAAAPPANDDFASAKALSGLSTSTAGTTVGATREPGEPDHGSAGGQNSVWYTWTAPSTGPVAIDICDENFAPGPAAVLAVYTGSSVSSLTRVALDDGSASTCGTQQGISGSGAPGLVFNATAGTQYRIAVDGFGPPLQPTPTSGPFTLRINPTPSNDTFAGALSTAPTFPADELNANVIGGENIGATKDASEPTIAGDAGGHLVWYAWTAPATANVRIDTCTSTFQTLLGVYLGALGSLNLLAADGPDPAACGASSQGSAVSFDATAGVTYHIAVDGKGGAVGSFAITFPPANDAFADAAPTVASNAIFATNVNASKQAGEQPIAGDGGGHTVWYSFVPSSAGTVVINTCGSDFPTLLGLYGPAATVTSTPTVGVGNGGCLAPQNGSVLTANVTAGQTYHVAIDGAGGATGNFVLRLAPVASNDAFANARNLTLGAAGLPAPGAAAATNLGATAEAGEPAHAGNPAHASLWYAFTAGSNGTVTLDTCSSSTFDTVLAVYSYSGSGGFAGLTPVASNDDTSICGSGHDSYVTFSAVKDTQYRIAVDGKGTQTGFSRLNIQPPANDSFANGVALTGSLPIVVTGNGAGASAEAGEPAIGGFPPVGSAWYTWTAPADGTVTVDTCATPVPTNALLSDRLGVYTGAAVNALTPVVDANGTGCPNAVPQSITSGGTFPARVTFNATSGTVYRISVEALFSGPFTLTINETATGGAGGGGGGGNPPPPTPGDPFVKISVPHKLSLKQLFAKGIKLAIQCKAPCSAKGVISAVLPATGAGRTHRHHKPTRLNIASGSAQIKAAGTGTLLLKGKPTARKRLGHAKKLTATLTLTTSTTGSATFTHTLKLKFGR
jgi:hypothetical protein